MEFSQDGATLVSSDGAETFWWDVATGARKDKVAGRVGPKVPDRVRILGQDPQDMGRGIGHVQGDAGRPQVPLSLSPAHQGRGVEHRY